MEAAQLSWRRIGSVLIAQGNLTLAQLEEAFMEQLSSGRRVGEILVERGFITNHVLAVALAQQSNLEFVDLAEQEPDPEVAVLLSEELARRYDALPVRRDEDGTVVVGVTDPTDIGVFDDLRFALGRNVRFVVVEGQDLERVVRSVYRSEIHIEDAEPADAAAAEAEREELDEAGAGAPAVKLVNATLSQAIDDGASDIHFAPTGEDVAVRIRVDGVMRELTTIPKRMDAGVVSRLKVMSSLDIAERRAPQDGRLFVRFDGRPVDLRIAVLPTVHGEQVVLRVLHRAEGQSELAELGMTPAAEQAFVRALKQPYGAVVVCGPTGSGKTTTLYSALQLLNDPGRVLMTIEDPVEYQIPGVAQIEVRPKSGLTFARGLRTILRSDPDVLLVGEIRDEETARIAVQAAMTGHTVLTSLHTHDAASSIARLKDMGVEPSLLATSLNCIVAQRLARRLCVSCREPYWPGEDEVAELGLTEPAGRILLHRPRGCARCAQTGYSGRVALYEVMPIEGALRGLIAGSTEEILAAAIEQGMTTLRQEGLRLCLEGVSSLEEIRRVTGDRLA